MNDQTYLIDRYQKVVNRLTRYCEQYQRDPQQAQLIAVSKRHSVDKIITLIEQGQQHFAENYLQEGLTKLTQVKQQLPDSYQQLHWHFIGHIQSRKCKEVAQNFDWAHTVESEKIATKLNQHRQGLTPLNVHIQLNLQNESSKSGIHNDQLQPLASLINTLPNLRLRGLMIIPSVENEFDKQAQVFAQCRQALETLNKTGFNLDHLSMGMTNDMQAAIAEGATQIRIGTAIFGARPE